MPITEIEVAMQWNDSYAEQVLCYTNNIPSVTAAPTLTGLRTAMTRVIGKYIEENEIARRPRSTSPATTCAKGACVRCRSRC